MAHSLVMQLKGTPCRALSKDTKIRSGPFPRLQNSTKGLYSYPDVVVVCGEPEYQDAHADVILNPAVIFEVLSSSTEAFDRGAKFTRYQAWNETLADYLLVSQDQPQIEHFSRQAGETGPTTATRASRAASPFAGSLALSSSWTYTIGFVFRRFDRSRATSLSPRNVPGIMYTPEHLRRGAGRPGR